MRFGCYLTVDEEGNLRGTEINAQTKYANPLLKCTWAILHRDNASIKKVVQVTDPILLKSSTGHFLRVEDQGVLRADSNTYNERSVWHLCRSNVPFIPIWARVRPFVSSSHLVPLMNVQLPIKADLATKGRPDLTQYLIPGSKPSTAKRDY